MLKACSFGSMSHIKGLRLPVMQLPSRALVKSVHSSTRCRVHQVANSNESLVLASGPVIFVSECMPAGTYQV